jgi:hypothetical protein
MLLDRNLIVDLIVVEIERENKYRHPPLYHCNSSIIIQKHSGERREEQRREIVKNTHVQIELIEENL